MEEGTTIDTDSDGINDYKDFDRDNGVVSPESGLSQGMEMDAPDLENKSMKVSKVGELVGVSAPAVSLGVRRCREMMAEDGDFGAKIEHLT